MEKKELEEKLQVFFDDKYFKEERKKCLRIRRRPRLDLEDFLPIPSEAWATPIV